MNSEADGWALVLAPASYLRVNAWPRFLEGLGGECQGLDAGVQLAYHIRALGAGAGATRLHQAPDEVVGDVEDAVGHREVLFYFVGNAKGKK